VRPALRIAATDAVIALGGKALPTAQSSSVFTVF
jgi:hypothetical protein